MLQELECEAALSAAFIDCKVKSVFHVHLIEGSINKILQCTPNAHFDIQTILW